jgi:hypothetical protein
MAARTHPVTGNNLQRMNQPLTISLLLAAITLSSAPSVIAQQYYAPSRSNNLPNDPNHQIDSVRDLTGGGSGEDVVVQRMMTAAEEYARLNPQYAPQVTRFRECYEYRRIKRGNLPEVGMWMTLPDELEIGGEGGRWIEPGGKGQDGGILPPNTVIIGPDQVDGDRKCDPNGTCLERANAIFTVIHEGFRQGNVGANTEPPCSLLANIVATYAADIAIWADFLENGVPYPASPPNPSWRCKFPAKSKDEMKARMELDGAMADLAESCDDLQEAGCPIPPECA